MSLSLDHVIILVPYASLVNPPYWITSNFTVTPGGRHSDGKTENKLICFRDGSYIELIAFINDDLQKRQGHWWDTEFGIVDFALTHSTGDATVHYPVLQERLKELDLGDSAVEVAYQKPVAGSRIRSDAQEVKWKVTFPVVTTGYQRGELPFFCHDVTPRSLRVPFSEESITHPSSALGVKSLSIFARDSKLAVLAKTYSAILGVSRVAAEADPQRLCIFEVKELKKVEGGHRTRFSLRIANEQSQLQAMEGREGSVLGDLVLGIAHVSGGTNSPKRIDTGEGGVGGVFLDCYDTK